jgi:hypothetical protein
MDMLKPITEHHTVIRPTMVPTLKEEGNRGTEVIMVPTNFNPDAPGPSPEPLTLVSAPGLTGDAIVGATITGTKAVYSGGVPPVEVQSQFQISDAASGSSWAGVDAWGTDSGGTHYISPDDVGKYFRVAGRAIDSSEDGISKAETLMSFSELLGPVVAEREPITVTTVASWADRNEYKVGETIYADTAEFDGGLEETTTYRWRTQTRPDSDGSITNGKWTNYTDAQEVSIALTEACDIRFQCQARDTGVDPVEQVNSFANWKTVEALPPLVVGTPKVTGEPYIGYVLSCSEPSIEGGSGDCQVDYFWVDETNAMIWEANYMGNTTTVIEYDLGKKMKCLVTVTDRVTGESETVASNEVGPINRPIIPEFDVWVNSELYEDPNEAVGVGLNGSVVCEVRAQPASNPAVDLAYKWQIRSGTGRLSGDDTATGIIYLAPDSAPAGALVNCTVSSTHAGNQSALAAEVTILIAE